MFLFSARLCYNIDVETGYSTSQEEGVTMKQTIITISREFGSGGHFIGEEVSKRLGIPFYDKNIIQQIAEKTGFSEDFVKEQSEYAPSKNMFAYAFVGRDHTGSSLSDQSMPPRHRLSAIFPKKDPASSSGAALTIF